ncbi:MAG: hypothetical protein ACK55I_49265, partial [bacterium]
MRTKRGAHRHGHHRDRRRGQQRAPPAPRERRHCGRDEPAGDHEPRDDAPRRRGDGRVVAHSISSRAVKPKS